MLCDPVEGKRNPQILPEDWKDESFQRLWQEDQKTKAFWGKRASKKSDPAHRLGFFVKKGFSSEIYEISPEYFTDFLRVIS
jgi:hypothetical protein